MWSVTLHVYQCISFYANSNGRVEHELKMNLTEMSMIRWMCGVKLNNRKNSEELGELLGLEPVSLMIKTSRLR